jgi:hypothetical protein
MHSAVQLCIAEQAKHLSSHGWLHLSQSVKEIRDGVTCCCCYNS